MRIERLLLHNVGPFADLDLSVRDCQDPAKADIHMLVGPNGSGKSTILYALAQMFSHEVALLAPRFHGRDSYVAIAGGDHAMAVVPNGEPLPDALQEVLGPSPSRLLSDGPLEYCDRPNNDVAAWIRRYRVRASGPLPEPAHLARAAFFASEQRPPPPPPLRFAAFAYSGSRTVGSYAIEAIQEPAGDPLAGALSFMHTVDSHKLAQWIANTKAKHALALARNDVSLAAKRARSMERVEQILGRIINRQIRFVLDEEPLAVKLDLDGSKVELDVLPDGLKSILSWIADVLMRLDRLPWHDDTPVVERSLVLFLDEIEIHLHPAWQRRVLPVVQELFPNAQIFLSTHSPFVVGSVSDAWIYPLTLADGPAGLGEALPSKAGESYQAILSEVFGIPEEFDIATEALFSEFDELKKQRLSGDDSVQARLQEIAAALSRKSVETRDIIGRELRQLERLPSPRCS